MKIGEYDFPDDLYYEKNHFWAKEEGGNVIIGATDFFQKLAGEIVFIEVLTMHLRYVTHQGKAWDFPNLPF